MIPDRTPAVGARAGDSTAGEAPKGRDPSLARSDPGERVHVEALDGLRGFAAISVLLHHAQVGNSHGFLAVDFFFCLSGFVIALAYENKLRQGLPTPRYMSWRLMRVYPMLFVGMVAGFLLWRFTPETGFLADAGASTFARAVSAHLFLIPFAGTLVAYPFNNVHWSIMYELIANAVHAGLVRWLNDTLLIAVIAASGAVLMVRAAIVGTINVGHHLDHVDLALARTLFSYFTGVLIFRHRLAITRVLPRIGFWWLAVALLIPASLHSVPPPFAWLEPARQVATAMILNPLVVALAVKSAAGGPTIRGLGVLSYPLYAIHVPLVYAGLALLGPIEAGLALKVAMLALCGPIVAVAYLLGRYVDLPLNRLRRKAFE